MGSVGGEPLMDRELTNREFEYMCMLIEMK